MNKLLFFLLLIPFAGFCQPFNGLTEMRLKGNVKTATIMRYDGFLDLDSLTTQNYFIRQIYHFDSLGYYKKIESFVRLGMNDIKTQTKDYIIVNGQLQVNTYENKIFGAFDNLKTLTDSSYLITSTNVQTNEIYDYQKVELNKESKTLIRKYQDLEDGKFVTRNEETEIMESESVLHLILRQQYNPSLGHIWYHYKKLDSYENPTITLTLNGRDDKKGNYVISDYTYYEE